MAEIGERRAGREKWDRVIARDRREYNLAAMADRHEACYAVKCRTEVVAVSFGCFADVQTDFHHQTSDCRKVFVREAALQIDRRGNCVRYPLECGAERVPNGLENMALVVFDCRANNRVVALHRRVHGGAMSFPTLRRTFYVR